MTKALDIRGFVVHVLELTGYTCGDVDADLEEAAIKYGLFDERPATAEDCETDWGRKYGVEVGDLVTAKSDALKAWLEGK